MKKSLTLLMVSLFLFVGTALAQTKITGTVLSQEDGQPIIGAAVKVVGTSTGMLTDVNGKFSLTLPEGKKSLTISYLGFESKTVNAKNGMRIFLKADAQVVDEVIVVAFGQQKKSAFTGSAAVVNSEDLKKHTVSNVTNALAGSVAGLQLRGSSGAPGAGNAEISIRGISSLYSETTPLVIVDGAPYPASLSNIPAEDIESVSVLKDAASAALYGARGSSGVIIITTKKGQKDQTKINVDVKWGANSRAVQEYDKITDPAQFYETYYSQLYNYGYYGQGMSNAAANQWANSTMLNHLGYNIYTVPEGQQLIGLDGKINPSATLGRSYTDANTGETYYMTADDWADAAYKTALRQEYNVSISSGNEKASFYASLGHLDEDGIIEYSSYKRTTARIKADYQVKPWMKLAANVGYVHSKQYSNPNMSTDWGSTNLMYYTSYIAPIYPIYVRVIDPATGQPVIRTDENGNPHYDYGVPGTNYHGASRGFLQTGNPLGSNRYNETYNIGNQLNGNFSLDINILKNLKFNATSTIILGQTSYSWYDNALYGPKVVANGELKKEQINTLRQNHVQTLTYAQDFGLHSVTLMAGHEYWNQTSRDLSGLAQGGFSADIKELNAFAGKNQAQVTSYTNEYNVEGYFANAQYSYDDKYFGSASFRRDASSRFAKDKRWGSFWSVGGAWIISKEKFMQSTKGWLDMLKIKASIGQQGNDNTSSFAYVDTYSLTPASSTQMSPSFRQIGNPDITWETLTNANIGLEFGLFKNRIQGSIDFYYKKTTDLLFWLSIPESAGTRGYYGNVGDIRNQGIEFSLTANIIRSKLVDWSVSANISHNATKILSLPDSKIGENGGFYESNYWYTVGGPLNNYMNYAYAGVNDKGEALYYYDEDLSPAGGKVSTNVISKPGTKKSGTTTLIGEASRYTDNGSTLPKAFGGFSSNLRVGDFDASVSFDYQIGGKVYDSGYAKLMTPASSSSDAGYNYHKDILKAWSPTNTNSDIPRFQYGDQYSAYSSDRWLTNASYLNFQSFTVGYTVPKKLVTPLGISNIRVYAAGENLCFWSARKGFDPRYSYKSTASTNVYSPVRTISGGVQLTF